MKKFIFLVSIMLLTAVGISVQAKVAVTNPATANAIKLYKSGDYTQSYLTFKKIVDKDPGNALASYYLAMSATQLGMGEEAVANYEKVILLSPNGVLGSYAKKGKRCILEPSNCNVAEKSLNELNETEEDRFIKGKFGSGFSDRARGSYEKQKIENLKREINREDYIPMERFKEYKDFSSQAPTDEEIVTAIRILKQAGLSDVFGGYNSDLSTLLGAQNYSKISDYDMLNMILRDNRRGTSNLNPQVIQSLLTNQMTTSF